MDAIATDFATEITHKVVIKNRLGLHARAAAKLAKAAGSFKSEVTLAKDELEVDARSILSLLSLGCAYNSQVVLKAAGVDAKDALRALLAIIEDGFGEE
ncbi:MAG: HPr family phosphocarrier protein [Deltaproteobacteria bacterium]|jgi:phosphocarrier protein|nr:HPr family phosphocarrier protein [Deltaproteobacteria bacterium]